MGNLPILKISDGSFYRQHPNTKSSGRDVATPKPLFEGLNISLPSFSSPTQHWAVLSPSSTVRTSFLQILRGQLVCVPPTARTYPYLISDDFAKRNSDLRSPEKAISYVGFDNEKKAFGGAYLSARYESRVEETDFTLEQYLAGNTELNASEDAKIAHKAAEELTTTVAKDLELLKLFKKPVNMLSNGQSRRARIGKALLTRPEMLLLDAPFIGLDPFVTEHISMLLERLSNAAQPRVFVSLRPQDVIPAWITHIVYADVDSQVKCLGPRKDVLEELKHEYETAEARIRDSNTPSATKDLEIVEVGRQLARKGDFVEHALSSQPHMSVDGFEHIDKATLSAGEPVIEMEGVSVKYGDNSVLGKWLQTVQGAERSGLWWKVRRGERWGIFGANGSGKTTLLSLITSDHPQTYSAPVRLFGRSRLPAIGQPGISIFELQSRIGHASPEVHSLFPKYLTVRKALESAFGDTPLTKPKLDSHALVRVDACLSWFEEELSPWYEPGSNGDLNWSAIATFADLSFSSQRVLLFLRALVRQPDVIILDEAFSGMDDTVRTKCQLFLSWGETRSMYPQANHQANPQATTKAVFAGIEPEQALLCVSHSRDDVPGCIREWIRLPESGSGVPRFGRLDGPVGIDAQRWDSIWGL